MSHRWTVVVLALAAAAACARRVADGGATLVTFAATEYAFQGPDTLAAGLTTLRLVNHGKELHHASIFKLGEGKSVADFQAAMADVMSGKVPPPAWVTYAGGPNAIDPGDSSTVTQVLDPGQYLVLCTIPGKDGQPHVMKGMFHPLVVTGTAPAPVPALPAADVTVKLSDYDFVFDRPLTAGTHSVRVDNAGPQPHEIIVAELAPGKSAADFVKWETGGEKGPLPANRWLGGVAGIDAGKSATFTVTLKPGNYMVICFWPDAKDGKPHLAHGMIKQITVS
jgi:uncharacterized cupredoxin-like copper-binding protein